MKRTLNLRRETLVDLTPDELKDVVGAEVTTLITMPMSKCLSQVISCFYC